MRCPANAFAGTVALFDDLPDREHLFPRNGFFLIGLGQSLLDVPVLCSGDLDGDGVWDGAPLYGVDQFLLAMVEEEADRRNILLAEPDLGRDFSRAVAALLEFPNSSHKLQRRMSAASEVLDEAHDEAIVFAGLDHDCGYLRLTESHKGFEPSLPAHQIITARPSARRDSDGSLEAQQFDAAHQLLENALIARPRVDHGDGVDWDHSDFGSLVRHAARSSRRRTRHRNGSSVSTR